MPINIAYVNNRNNLVNVNFSVDSEYPSLDLGNDLSSIDIQNIWDTYGYDASTYLLLTIKLQNYE